MKYYSKQYKNKKYHAKKTKQYIMIGSTTHIDTCLNVIG